MKNKIEPKNYSLVVRPILDDPKGRIYYKAEMPAFEGNASMYGDTVEDAIEGLYDVFPSVIEMLEDSDLPIPEPDFDPYGKYSGRFVVRTTSRLHGEIAQRAARERVSLNNLVQIALAKYI